MNKQDTLTRAIELAKNIDLPWPDDIFGGFDRWEELDEFLKTLGYRVDNVSAELMRRGWKVYQRQLLTELNDLADNLPEEGEA